MQSVLRPPSRRIRLRLQPPRLIILAAGDAPVGMLLLHHPLQATLAFRVQHLPPVQAVRDDYPALSVLKAVVQPLRVDLLRHPTGIIIPVAALRPPRIMVRHHPPGVLRIISKPAHLHPAAVIHRPQFTTGRVRVARQRRSRLFIRVCRVVCCARSLPPACPDGHISGCCVNHPDMSLTSVATGCCNHTVPSCRPAVPLKSAFQTPYAAGTPSAAPPHPSAPSASPPHHTRCG
ncbi:Uncharacterised protein [Shigella sonnei]|nr:Uncharacterised protein [Shigella sonnei]